MSGIILLQERPETRGSMGGFAVCETFIRNYGQEDASKNWTYTWTELPKKDEKGHEYTYYVKEEDVPAGFGTIRQRQKGK